MKKLKRVLAILTVSMLLACSVFAAGGSGTGGGTGAGTGGGSGSGAGGNKETTEAVETSASETTEAEIPEEEATEAENPEEATSSETTAAETPAPGTGGGVRPLSVVSVTSNGADLSGATVAASGTITVKFSNGMATYAEDTKKVIKIDGQNFPTTFDAAYKNDFVVNYSDLEPGTHSLTIGKNAMSNNGQTLESAYSVRFQVEGKTDEEETKEPETTQTESTPEETTPEETTAEVTSPEESKAPESSIEESKENESSIVAGESSAEELPETSKAEESESSTAPAATDKNDTPNTGDHNTAAVFAIVFLASACGLVLFSRKRRA